MVIFNETLTGACFALSLVFDNDMTEDESAMHGKIIIALVSSVVLANVLIVLVDTLKHLI